MSTCFFFVERAELVGIDIVTVSLLSNKHVVAPHIFEIGLSRKVDGNMSRTGAVDAQESWSGTSTSCS
jgi:hypothetical protein